LQVQITRSANEFALRVNWTCTIVPNAKLWLEKAIKCIFIQIDASNFAEFGISEFDISRFDCKYSRISISRSWWDFFLSVQITRIANNLHFG